MKQPACDNRAAALVRVEPTTVESVAKGRRDSYDNATIAQEKRRSEVQAQVTQHGSARQLRRGSSQTSGNAFTPEAWLGLMSKNAAAFADLQMRLIRCRSPVELWTEQLRYIKGRIDDAQAVLKVSVTSRRDIATP